MDRLKEDSRTQILYESPKRILALLQDLKQIMGERRAVLCRELTKLHEEIIRGSVSDILIKITDRERIRGEITLVLSGFNDSDSSNIDDFEAGLQELAPTHTESLPALAKKLAKQFKISRKEAYNRLLSQVRNDI
jgi:16S rRNA (cytidine1402-2'-O)-methyltransferase